MGWESTVQQGIEMLTPRQIFEAVYAFGEGNVLLLFGLAIALELRFQLLGVTLSPYLLKMLPYVLTIVVLTLVTIRNNRRGLQVMPAALGLVFFRGEKH